VCVHVGKQVDASAVLILGATKTFTQEKLIKTQMNDLFLKLQQDFAEQTRNAAQLMQDKEDEWRARETDLKDQIDANERRCAAYSACRMVLKVISMNACAHATCVCACMCVC
jgi:hypothetical protein